MGRARYLGKHYGKYNHYIYLRYEYKGFEYEVVDTQTGEAFDEFSKQHRENQQEIDRRIKKNKEEKRILEESPAIVKKDTFNEFMDEFYNSLG